MTNRKQRRGQQSQTKLKTAVHFGGKAYTIEEACALAMKEQGLGHLPVAVDIYDRILVQAPQYSEVYNNRGVALQDMKRYEEALLSYGRAITCKPDNAEAYINRGVTLQALKRYEEALTNYDKAVTLKPENAEVHNNRGVTLQALKRYEEALTSYEKAIALKPGYSEVHNNRGVILQETLRYEEAIKSYDKAIACNPRYAEAFNNRADTLHKMHRYNEALINCDAALALRPDYAEAYNNRGNVLLSLKQYKEALISYDKAIGLQPDYAEAYNNRGVTLQEMRLYDEALVSCDKAVALDPGFANAHSTRGSILQKLKRYDEALKSCDAAIALKPDYAGAYQNKGLILVNKGKMAEAEVMFRKAIALKPDFPDPLSGLIHIKQYHDATHPDIKAIRALLGSAELSADDREYLSFALGKIYDDCGLYDEAFAYYRQANEIRNKNIAYNAEAVEHITQDIISTFSKEFLAQTFPFASKSSQPVFIVGMPRSGTTLMASILSNHPSVATAGELPTMAELVAYLPKLVGMDYPQAARHISPEIAQIMITAYEKRLQRDVGHAVPGLFRSESAPRISSPWKGEDQGGGLYPPQELTVDPHRHNDPHKILKIDPHPNPPPSRGREQNETALAVPYIIDKHPLNFRHLGLIALLFPKAKVIHCTRHPLDTVLSNYFQRFTLYYDYAFDLKNIAHFYNEYARLMAHWRKVLPQSMMLEVSYEDMIAKTEATARRALTFLDLPWDARCLAPHTNSNPVETASQWQVRQPIYHQSVGRWKHYEEHLAQLKGMVNPSA